MFVAPRDEIAQFLLTNTGQIEQRGPWIVEVVNERLAHIRVVLKEPFQAALFEDHPVMNAGGAALLGGALGMALNGLVIGLGPARERGEQVMADDAQVQFIKAAATLRLEVG